MTKTNSKLLTLLLICLLSASKSFSQGVPADSMKNMLVNDWMRAKAYTNEYLDAMPASKYSFRATDSVRTFAQQYLHLAQANLFLISNGSGGKPSYAGPNLEQSASAQNADSVRYYVNMSYDYAINEIKRLSPSSFFQPVSINMGREFTVSRLGWIMKAFEHQTHHRGQTTIYLRLAGVHPPQERLF
jgi:uncharacterized damage-inducible protein DinB